MLFRRLGQECHFTKEDVLRLTLSQALAYLADPVEEEKRKKPGVEVNGPGDWDAIIKGLEQERENAD